MCHWKQTSEERESSGCEMHPWVSPLFPFRYNYAMKKSTEIRFIPNDSDFLNLPFFWYQLISYNAEALKALQEAVKAIEPFIAITLN